jgi:photosystem II stability/assembly factor-like uncharacterized protein
VQTFGTSELGPKLYKSANNGETWQKTTDFGINTSLVYQVHVSEDSTYAIFLALDSLFIVKNGQVVYRNSLKVAFTNENGAVEYVSWQPSYNSSQIVQIGSCWFAASYRFGVARSDDSGRTWFKIQSCPIDSPNCKSNNFLINDVITKIGPTLIAATAKGVITSTDSGKTWQEDTLGSIHHLVVLADTQIFAATPESEIFKSSDTAKTWVQVNDGYPRLSYGKNERLREMTVINNNVCLALQSGVYIFKNKQWTPAASNWPAHIRPIILFSSKNTLFCTSTDGIYKVHNDSWNRVDAEFEGAKGGINTIISHQDELWAGGWHGIFYSKDSGKTWQNRSMGIEDELYIMDLSSNSFGLFAACLGSGVYKWNELQQIWKPLRYGNKPEYQTGYFVRIAESKRGLYVQRPWGQGLLLIDPERELIDSINTFVSYVIYASGDTLLQGADFGLARSYNAGKTWDTISGLNSSISDILKKGDTLVMSSTNSFVNVSKDNGTTWKSYSLPSGFSLGRQLAFKNDRFYALTLKHLNYSTDPCSTWTSIPLPSSAYGNWFRSLLVKNDLIAISSEYGLWINQINDLHPAAIQHPSTRLEQTPYQISRENIHIKLSDKGILVLDVINLQGKLISTQNTGLLEPGSHRLMFPRNLATGVFILRMQLNGKYFVNERIIRK